MSLEVIALNKRFGPLQAAVNVSFAVAPGETLALLGPSGCGKTTVLRIIAGLADADTGQVRVDGQNVEAEPAERRKIGLVFQDFALFPHLTVAENVGFGLRAREAPDARARVAEMLALVDLDGFEHRAPHTLSGGQRQRVAVARALAPAPRALLLDEPFSSLDAGLRRSMRADLRRVLTEAQIPAVLVTHDKDDAFELGDQLAVMNHGVVEQCAAPEAIFERPATPFVAEFLTGARTFPEDAFTGSVAPGRGPISIRADAVRIAPEGALVGVVEACRFVGERFLLSLNTDAGRIDAYTATRFTPGEDVRFSLDAALVKRLGAIDDSE